MFRFFRHIRQRLFLERKVSRYIGYAVGEIVLIVVGILIALQINDWNEERKERVEERQVLGQIYAEMEVCLETVERWMPRFEQKEADLNEVLGVVRGQTIEDSSKFLITTAESANLAFNQPEIPSTTFDEITSSGKIGLIQNVVLRNKIRNLYHQFENIWRGHDARRGDYPKILYRLFVWEDGRRFNKDDMNPEEQATAIAAMLESEIEPEILNEINRNAAMISSWRVREKDIEELLKALEAELANN